jgi:glucan-binding YG repeat protein
MKTVAQLLKHDFEKGSLRLYDSNGNKIYFEHSDGFWAKREFDSNGNQIYYENSDGEIIDNRPKPSCEGKVVEIDGKMYKLVELNK